MTDPRHAPGQDPANAHGSPGAFANALTILRVSTVGRRHAEIAALALRAEAGGFDALLISDDGDTGGDPIVTACALGPLTSRLRLIPTVDTARQHPFALARKLVGFDQISGGRAAWAPEDELVERLVEAVTLTNRLCESWPADAIVADKEAAIWIDIDRISPVEFDGQHYSVHAPLDMPRGPQGRLPMLLPAALAEQSGIAGIVLEAQRIVDYEDGELPAVPASEAAVAADSNGKVLA